MYVPIAELVVCENTYVTPIAGPFVCENTYGNSTAGAHVGAAVRDIEDALRVLSCWASERFTNVLCVGFQATRPAEVGSLV